MKKKENLTCILCPRGCNLKVSIMDKKVTLIEGHICKKGESYAHEEIENPLRILCTTIPITNGIKHKTVPVKTNIAIPKSKLLKAMEIIKKTKTTIPLTMHQVIIKNILDTGADIITSRSIDQ